MLILLVSVAPNTHPTCHKMHLKHWGRPGIFLVVNIVFSLKLVCCGTSIPHFSLPCKSLNISKARNFNDNYLITDKPSLLNSWLAIVKSRNIFSVEKYWQAYKQSKSVKSVQNKHTNLTYLLIHTGAEKVKSALRIGKLFNGAPYVSQLVDEVCYGHDVGIIATKCPGEPLQTVYGSHGCPKLEISQIALIIRKLSTASLTMLHRGVWHRDMISQNIHIVPESLEICIFDFHLDEPKDAKFWGVNSVSKARTRAENFFFENFVRGLHSKVQTEGLVHWYGDPVQMIANILIHLLGMADPRWNMTFADFMKYAGLESINNLGDSLNYTTRLKGTSQPWDFLNDVNPECFQPATKLALRFLSGLLQASYSDRITFLRNARSHQFLSLKS